MQMQNLYQMITRRYRHQHRHLDRSRLMGQVKELGAKVQHPDYSDPSDGPTIYFRVVAPAAMVKRFGREAVRQALHDYYTYTGCDHERDCCGCQFSHASVRCVRGRGGRVFTVQQAIGYNY